MGMIGRTSSSSLSALNFVEGSARQAENRLNWGRDEQESVGRNRGFLETEVTRTVGAYDDKFEETASGATSGTKFKERAEERSATRPGDQNAAPVRK